jgi:hypothetical protein
MKNPAPWFALAVLYALLSLADPQHWFANYLLAALASFCTFLAVNALTKKDGP